MAKQHVFISYCRDNIDDVQRLIDELNKAGEKTWWDKDMEPGDDWKYAIRQAMKQSYAVLVCLSKEAEQRSKSYMYPEIKDAISYYREYAPGNAFIFPVRLSECEIPPIAIDSITTLQEIQYEDLFPENKWDRGVKRIITALKKAPEHP